MIINKPEAKVILDTLNPYTGDRLTTLALKYWRPIHSEFMTHRCVTGDTEILVREGASYVTMTAAEMFEKHSTGLQFAEPSKVNRFSLCNYDRTLLEPGRFYTVTELSNLYGMSPSRIYSAEGKRFLLGHSVKRQVGEHTYRSVRAYRGEQVLRWLEFSETGKHVNLAYFKHNKLVSWDEHNERLDRDTLAMIWKMEPAEVMELTTESGSLKATPDHRVYTYDGWKQLKEISTNDLVVKVKMNTPYKISFRYEKVESIKPAGREVVYDLSVFRHASYISNGFVSHNCFSRNAQSSRARPVTHTLDKLEKGSIWGPVEFGKNQKGMTAKEVMEGSELHLAQLSWVESAKQAAHYARELMNQGVHKQVVNRILEPYTSIEVLVSATDWDNFFKLRLAPDAQPEMRELAQAIKDAMDASTPVERTMHLPFITEEESHLNPTHLSFISAARCARVSYTPFDSAKPDLDRDTKLAKVLATHGHFSPFEHVAMVVNPTEEPNLNTKNFKNFHQFRSVLEEEGTIEFLGLDK